MRVKYLGTKIVLVLATFLATPLVWAALAWPEWSAASPALDDGFVEVETAAMQPTPETPVQVQQVIHRIIVVPRYVEVPATPVAGQSGGSAPAVNTAAPAPTPPATAVVQTVAVNTSRQEPSPPQRESVAAGGSGRGNDTASSPPPADPPPSSSGSSQSSSGAGSGGSGSQSKTKGS